MREAHLCGANRGRKRYSGLTSRARIIRHLATRRNLGILVRGGVGTSPAIRSFEDRLMDTRHGPQFVPGDMRQPCSTPSQ